MSENSFEGPVRASPDQEMIQLRDLLSGPKPAQVAQLLAFWNRRDPELWRVSADPFILLGQRMASMGEPLAAYDIATEGLKFFPTSFELRRLRGFALARSGAVDLANLIFSELHQENPRDIEAAGMLASTCKDLAALTRNQAQKESLLRQAHILYASNFERSDNYSYWSGINAATTALLCGNRDLARIIATRVMDLCKSEISRLSKSGADEYWILATLGEAALIMGSYIEAEQWYSKVTKCAGTRYADMVSTRRNARLVLRALDVEDDSIEGCFRFPSVAVFVGHMIDRPGRQKARFPQVFEERVASEIQKRLDTLNIMFGYASAACGSDILFVEAMLRRGAEIHIVLPYDAAQFLEDSVDIGALGDWKERFNRATRKVAEVITISGQRSTGETVLYSYANRMILGLGGLLAKRLDTQLRCLAVWDENPGDGPGGTADTVEMWRASGQKVDIINLLSLPEKGSLTSAQPATSGERLASSSSNQQPISQPDFGPEICSILFADAVGFSKLSEDEVRLFVKYFLGLVREVLDVQPCPPLMKNTWGDGLYFVFSSALSAGRFALELRDRIKANRWSDKGLPDLDLRIALHSGPLYRCIDPVTQQTNYIGFHASRAARIEPITPPGQVYASQAFAAQSWAEGATEFKCGYVGMTPMAKGYGCFPIYVVKTSVDHSEAE
jgi:class 3 adenylate cyclase